MKIKSLLPFLLLAAASPALEAQELLDINTEKRCVFSGGQMDEELYRFERSDKVTAQVKEIADLGDVPLHFVPVQTNVENAAAVLDSNRRYLLYSLDFIEKAEGIEVYGALAHEIGHHANEHAFSEERRHTEELEADQFMGYVLSKKGFAWPDIESFLTKMPSPYGISPEERLEAARQGFDKAVRALQINTLPFEDDPKVKELTLPGFPWPPPSCFARYELPQSSFSGSQTLGDAERKVLSALDAKGYAQRSYFSVPGGFALVTQLEQYEGGDGSARNDRTRWLDYPAKDNFAGVIDYLKSIVMPQKGYFRIFVFIVTDRSFGGGTQRVSKEQATAWLSQGFNKLPRRIADAPFTADCGVTALVYEFEVPESNRKPVQKCPSPRFDALTHLQKAGIAAALGF